MQLDLLSSDRADATTETRGEPRLWVRKLVIWKDPDTIIRSIDLRPGLNIIWSPDPADSGKPNVESNALGHGSGKTLFCRLLRYCLGEERFADEGQRHDIAYAFGKGFVGAEVIVEGRQWAIVRPIGLTRRHFAVPEITLDQLLASDTAASGIKSFRSDVEETILTRAVADLIAAGESSAWLTALAWLTRDQECRFDHPLDWRSPASDSDSPARGLSAQARLTAVRALIGAIVPAEVALRERVDVMTEQQKFAQAELDRRAWEAGRLRTRLATELSVPEQSIPPGALGAEVLRKAATEHLAAIAGVNGSADVTNIDSLRESVEELSDQVSECNASIREAEALLNASIRIVARIEAEQPGLSAELLAGDARICPVCEVPVDQALADRCNISLETPDLLRLRNRVEQAKRDLIAERERIESLETHKRSLETKREAAEPTLNEARILLRAAEKTRDARETGWADTRARVSDAKRLIALLAELDRARAGFDDQQSAIEREKETLAAFRDQHASVFQRLSMYFHTVIRDLIPTASGRVTLDGNGLKLSVELGGERSTVAIDSLKVIAFDLAVMRMSIEDGIQLPAFFVHDSPREADLGLSVYERLFRLVRTYEPDERPAPFQYIVTTTTPPPEELRTAPWLAAVLRGTPAEERLLGQDL